MDWRLYKYRHLVENAFARLKQFRAIVIRYDKLNRNFKAMLSFVCGFLGCQCQTSTDSNVQIKTFVNYRNLVIETTYYEF